MVNQPTPGAYRPLGNKLKQLRENAKETLDDASQAVEIDVKQLASFELGQARPSEDILLLLISHFGVKDSDALRLWEMAGYGSQRVPLAQITNEIMQAIDYTQNEQPKILFTDVVDVIVNNYGVVMNFMQGAGPNNQPNAVARVGMSREHAKSVLQILQATLAQTEPRTPSQPRKLSGTDNSTPDERA